MRGCGPILLGWLLSLATASFAMAEEDGVLAASSGRHVFVVRADVEGQGWSIAHLDTEEGPGLIRTVHRLKSRPEAIAASGNRCWAVLPPRDAERVSRVVISLAVGQHPINGVWFADPPGPPQVLPPVPRDGQVVGLAATGSELLLVFGPSQRHQRGIERPDRPSAEGDDPSDAEQISDSVADLFPDFDPDHGGFMRLGLPGSERWEFVPGPEDWGTATGVRAGLVARASGLQPAVIWSVADRDGRSLSVFDPASETPPLTSGIEGMEGVPLALVSLSGRTMVAARESDGRLAIGDLLQAESEAGSDRIRPFAVVAEGDPAPHVGVVLTQAGPWVIGVSGSEVVTTTLDRSNGRTSDALVAEEATAEGTLVPYEIALFIVVASFVVVFLLRPALSSAPSVVAPGLKGLGFARRAAGLCVDLAPGAMAVVVIFNLDPLGYVEQLRAGEMQAIPPLLALMAISGLFAGVLEVLTGRSLGKWLVGGRILRLDGSPASALQRGLRSALRLSILLLIPLAWPIALLPLLDPAGRGIPELMTRTVVASGSPPASD